MVNSRSTSATCLPSTQQLLLGIWICYLLSTAAAQQAVHGRQLAATHNSTSNGSSCQTKKGVALLTLAYLGKNEDRQRSYLYWLSIASKRLYAHAWNYPLYVVPHRLQPFKHPAWEKLIAVAAIMRHSCAEWVWVTDGDAFNMDLQLDIQDVIKDELRKSKQQNGGDGKTVDVMFTYDCNEINTGSILFRHSDWMLQHLADIWFTDGKSIYLIDYWWENAAIIHLLKHPEVKPHYHKVPQVRINAYGTETNCSDGSGTFKKGTSLIYHAPGGYKHLLSAEHEYLLPVLQASNVAVVNKNRDARVYAIYSHAHPPHGVRSFQSSNVTNMHVHFQKSSVAGPSDGDAAPISFELDIALKPRNAVNPGWPVMIPAFLRHMIGAVLGLGRLEHQQNHEQHKLD